MQAQPSQRRLLKIKLARSLPAEIADSLSSIDNANKLEYIAKQYGLDSTKIKAVASEIGEYAIGLTPYGALPQNLKNKTGLPLDIAQKLINNILQDVYGSIKIPLQKYLATVKIDSSSPQTAPRQQNTNTSSASAPTNKSSYGVTEITAPHDLELPGSVPVQEMRASFTSEKPLLQEIKKVTPRVVNIAPTPKSPLSDQTNTTTPVGIKSSPIRTLETDIAKSALEEQKKPISIPKQTIVREKPQINPSTGNYAKDPYREQI